jgi:separase
LPFVRYKYQGHIVLLLDKTLVMFPWESMPALRQKSVSRLPSFIFLRKISSMPNTVNRKSLGFVLNPGGDLTSTQNTFEKLFSKKEWSGIIGKTPSETEYLELLKKDIFIYFGHGGGETFAKGSKIRKLEKCSVSLLFGCSSGRLFQEGDFDAYGTVYDYLLGQRYSL